MTFGFGGIGGFTIVSVAAAAPRDFCGSAGFAVGLISASGWLKILP